VESTDKYLATNVANTVVAVFIEQNDALQADRFASSEISLKTQLDALTGQIRANEAAIASLGTPQTDSRRSELERLRTELAQYQASYTSLLQSYEELRIAKAGAISNVIQVEPAEPPREPVRPRILLNTLLAGVTAGMLALGIIFLNEHLDDSIRTQEDVERIFQVPVLGYVAESEGFGSQGQGRVLLTEEPPPVIAEAFRSLRTNLEFSGNLGGPRTILISSPGPGDGKTTIASYLAATIAKGGKRAILIDADLRRPGVHRFFGVKNELGLSDMLKDDLVPQVATQPLGNHRFKLITSGTPVDNAAELFRSLWLLKVLNFLREQADVAIFDGPPFLATEAYILASRLESVLMVIQPGKTHEPPARAILEQLERAKANLLGVVLNRVSRSEAYPAASYLYYENDRDGRQGSNPGKSRSTTNRSTGAPQPTRGQPLHLRKDDPDR
jgi:capsular exopolysaccharide synthesis family protein